MYSRSKTSFVLIRKNMNTDLGRIVIVGQMLNQGQFKVTPQGHFKVNLHQESPGDHVAFFNFSDSSIRTKYILICSI